MKLSLIITNIFNSFLYFTLLYFYTLYLSSKIQICIQKSWDDIYLGSAYKQFHNFLVSDTAG